MKHITIVTRSMFGGGAERVIAELAKYISKKNIKCTIITIDDEEVFYDIPSQVEIYAIGIKSKNKIIDKILKYKEVRRYTKVLKSDIVLSLPEDIGIYVIPAMLGTGIPVVVSERNNPWVMPWKKESRIMRKIFYPFAQGFIFQTEYAKNFFPKNIRKKGIILPNPLDLNRIPEPWDGKCCKQVIGAGRLDSQKNFPLLIRAFSKFNKIHPEYTLIIYGEGQLKEELEELADSCIPKNNYRFPGKTPNLLEKMREGAMFVLTSDYEGMPNVLIEAMSLGMPVISTDCPSGGPAEMIEDGKNGLLVTVGDIDELNEAMCKIANSKTFSIKIGEEAKKIKEILDSNIVADQWIKYLQEIYDKNKLNK